MVFLKALLGIAIFISIAFFILGLISQKGKAPGLDNGRLKDCGTKPNAVCSEEGVQPERHVAPIKASLAEVKAAIIKLGGTITTASDDYISATFMSKVFKFIDDVELRDGGDGIVHIRSSSRVGYSDNGVNHKRVEAIRAAIKQ